MDVDVVESRLRERIDALEVVLFVGAAHDGLRDVVLRNHLGSSLEVAGQWKLL
jgi:hypothetical protein